MSPRGVSSQAAVGLGDTGKRSNQARWVRLLITGEEEVVAEFLSALRPRLAFKLTQRYRGLLNDDEIEDIVLTAVNRLWFTKSRFDPAKGSIFAWLMTTARNDAHNRINCGWRKSRRLEKPLAPPLLEQFADDDSSETGERQARSPETAARLDLMR